MSLKKLLASCILAVSICFSQAVYSIPSLTTMVTGLSRACASIVMPLCGLIRDDTPVLLFGTEFGTLVEEPLKINDKTRTKLKTKLAPEIDLDAYRKDIYLTADALGSSGYIVDRENTDGVKEKKQLRAQIALPVNAFQKSSVRPIDFYRIYDHVSGVYPSDQIAEKSGELLTDEDLDMYCAYIKRDVQFEKSGALNRRLSKLPLPLVLLPTICTLPLYYADKKLTAGFAASITKSLIAAPTRIAVAACLGVVLSGIGNVAAHRLHHHVEEEKDKYIDQKDIPLFKKHLEATLKHVQSGKQVEYNPRQTLFDTYPRYRTLVDGMQQKSLERRIKALASRSEISANSK